MACLDTTILIDLLGNKSANKERAFAKIDQLTGDSEPLYTTRFNLAELYVGIERSKSPKAEEKLIGHLLKFIKVLEFDERSARLFGQITAYLQMIGKPAGDMDVLIAATSLGSTQKLITRNARHFENIPQLKVEEY